MNRAPGGELSNDKGQQFKYKLIKWIQQLEAYIGKLEAQANKAKNEAPRP